MADFNFDLAPGVTKIEFSAHGIPSIPLHQPSNTPSAALQTKQETGPTLKPLVSLPRVPIASRSDLQLSKPINPRQPPKKQRPLPWSKFNDESLLRLRHEDSLKYKDIAASLGRDFLRVQQRYNHLKKRCDTDKAVNAPWTREEDLQLMKARDEGIICMDMPDTMIGRTALDCAIRLQRLREDGHAVDGAAHHPWTDEEDQLLIKQRGGEIVYGNMGGLDGRTPEACADRIQVLKHRHLLPDPVLRQVKRAVEHHCWTEAEDRSILYQWISLMRADNDLVIPGKSINAVTARRRYLVQHHEDLYREMLRGKNKPTK